MNHFTSNLIFTPEGCYAVYRLKERIYNFISKDRKERNLQLDNTLLQLIAESSSELMVYGKPYTSSFKNNTELLKKTFRGPLKDVAKQYVDGHVDEITIRRGDTDNEIIGYILVKIKRPFDKGNFIKGIGPLVQDGYYEGMKFLGLADEIPARHLEDYLQAEKDLHMKIGQFVSRVNEYDIEWLNRTVNVRGIGAPDMRSKREVVNGSVQEKPWRPGVDIYYKKGQKILVPRKRDMITLFDCQIHQEQFKRHITVDTSQGKSYQSFAAVSNLHDLSFPGGEWLYYLNTLEFPVEWCMRIEFISNDKMKDAVRNQKNVVDSQIEHTAKVAQVPGQNYKAEEQGSSLENDVKAGGEAHTHTKFILCVAADSEGKLKERQESLRQYMKTFDAEIHFPSEDQQALFIEMLPGAQKQSKNFIHKLPTQTIAGYMFNATQRIGEQIGYCIGTTGVLQKPVLVDLRQASQRDKSPSVASMGTLGGGKSLLMKLLALNTAMMGGKALIIDPKEENQPWPDYLPWLKDFYETIKLDGSDEFIGMLDPYMIFEICKKQGVEKEKAKREAYSAAVTILAYMMDAKSGQDLYLAISKAAMYARDHEVPCMLRILEYCDGLFEADPANLMLKDYFIKLKMHLENFKSFKVTSLLFGDGNNASISINKPITVLQIQGLVLPDNKKSRDEYTPEEIASSGVAIGIFSIIRKFAFSDRSIFKFIGMDERWFIERIEAGKQLVEEILRQGRTLNTGIHLIDQNATGYSDEVRNLIGLKFVYRTPNEEQAKSALDFLDLEHTAENIDLVKNIPKYHVLMKDMDDRVGLVEIDVFYVDVLEAFNTRPEQLGGDDDEISKAS